MARKKGFDYFGAMEHLANDALKASELLEQILLAYDPATLDELSQEIHAIEQDGDEDVKNVMHELYISFITPIDREDIVQMVEKLDSIIDGINAITYELHYLNIQELRPGTDEYIHLITGAVDSVQNSVKEFSHFKNSKMLMSNIEAANHFESLGDSLYTKSLAKLFREDTDAIDIIRWQKIYSSFEKVLDSSEDTADVITGLVIKNS